MGAEGRAQLEAVIARAVSNAKARTPSWYHAGLRVARLGGALLLGGCSHQSAVEIPRAASDHPTPTHAGSAAPRVVAPWLERAASWPLVTAEAILSQHLGEPHLAEIRVSPEARQAYLELGAETTLPEGTWIVQWLRHARNGKRGPIFALERKSAGWEFWVLDPNGTVQRSGALEPCTGCHAAAPAPPVFGLPRRDQESTAPARRSPE